METWLVVIATVALGVVPGLIAFGRSWNNGHDALKETVDVLRRELNEVRSENADIRLRLASLEAWAHALVAQIRAAGLEPVSASSAAVIPAMTRAKLSRMIADSFNVLEMEELALDVLNIEPAEIVGATPSAKARNLVTAASGRGKLGELTRRVAELRPHLFEG